MYRAMKGDRGTEDVFARIAAERQETQRAGLIEPEPPVLPDVRLCASRSDPSVRFRPARRISTEKELAAELARQRRLHAPFLRNLAPAMEETRIRVPLEEFDWRVETAEDRLDFPAALAGSGRWEKVRVPHYGAPVGRAAAYYRTEFTVSPAMTLLGSVFLRFEGVDYRAHVFVNGSLVASHEGFFAPFEADCTGHVRVGRNALLVKVENDYIHMGNADPAPDGRPGKRWEGEKLYAATGPGYDDPLHGWHHCPPGMGIYQKVRLEARRPVHVHDLFVRPDLAGGGAEAWVEVRGPAREEHEIRIEYSVHGANFRAAAVPRAVHAPSILPRQAEGDVPGKDKPVPKPLPVGSGVNLYRIRFSLPHPRAWEPETPWLYELQVRLRDASGALLDAAAARFGMRSFSIEEKGDPKGRILLNGRPIRLRGANTMGFEQQDVIRGDAERLIDDILLAKICRMNFLRLTQRPVQAEVYEYCDRLGLMTQTDLPLFGVLRRTGFAEAVRQAEEMERLVRGHPCNVLVTYINEAMTNSMGEPHRHLTRPELDSWTRAADRAVRLANPDRAIKPHDGDYDPPEEGLPDHHCYNGWYNGHALPLGRLLRGYWQKVKPGWLYGCGEFGSEGLDPVDLMRRRYPADWLPASAEEERTWSPSRIVQAQTGRFHYMWFDTQTSVADWVRASQEHQARMTRLMTEAFRRDSRMVSFAIHLFIDAFPSGWMKSILDCERRPKEAFFAYRDALAPTAVSLRTDRFTVHAGEEVRAEAWVCHDGAEAVRGLRLAWRIECGGALLHAGSRPAAVPACTSRFQGFLSVLAPAVEYRTLLGVHLALLDAQGSTVHDAALEVEVFPEPEPAAAPRCAVLGGRGGPAARLAKEMGLKASTAGSLDRCGTVLIDDPGAFRARQAEVLRAVRRGATALFLELPPGEWDLAGSPLRVRPTGMGEFFFVSRATGHPLVAGFQPEDFRLWFDPAKGYVTPLLATTLAAPGWETVLSTGEVSWTGDSVPAQAAVQKRLGRGALRVCQVRLAGRLANPVAGIFARRLIAPAE